MESFCLTCGKEFRYFLGNSSGKFCSRDCYNQSVKIPTKECIYCGNLYTPERGTKNSWLKSKYCSLDCLNKSKFKGKYDRCIFCGITIWIKPSQKTKKFCSNRCKNNSLRGKSGLKYYRKGYRAEYEAIQNLKKEGYITWRNFLSWGQYDIGAIGENHARLIQVKSSQRKLPLSAYKKSIENLMLFNVPNFINKELWIRQDYHGWTKYTITDISIKLFEEKDIKKLLNGEIVIGAESFAKINPRGVIDMFIVIDKTNNSIKFIQCSNNFTEEQKEKLRNKYKWLNGTFICDYIIR